MASSRKIRVALIGLSAPPKGSPTGTSWAANGHLPYLTASDKYQVVALQNSSVHRAAEAIKAFSLNPDTTRAYGTPEDVANDPDIDLVVSSIRVDRHANSVIPAIRAGKDVFVEWPLEANSTKAKELAELVKVHGVRNIVGLQGRYNPTAQKIKDIIARGDIGKLESSTLIARGAGGASLSSALDYFTDKKTGGNSFTIMLSHTMETVQQALGDITHHTSLLANQYPTVSIVDSARQQIIEKERPNDVPNQVVLNAVLSSGALLTYKLHGQMDSGAAGRRSGKPKVPSTEWRIFGSSGEIHITIYESMLSPWSLCNKSDVLNIEIYNARDDTLTELDPAQDEFENLPPPARDVARLYEAFAAARDGKDVWYPDFDYGVKKHELIDAIYKENESRI